MIQDHPIQKISKLGVAALGGFLALSTIPGLWIGLFGSNAWDTEPLPLLAGFEALTLLAALVAVLVGIRPRKEGFGLAGLCIAGAVMVAAVLGSVMLKNSSQNVPSLTNFVLLRLACSGGFVVMTALVMLGGRSDCWKRVGLGLVLLLPIAVVLSGKTSGIAAKISDLGSIVSMTVYTFGAIGLGLLTIAGGHFLIRAFELTRETKEGSPESE